ncbi:MAG: hypothetical protein KC619_26630 [Myxococcales bacterium]|nr:hypothetical protein [Myxococcales bacterium]
MAILPFVIVGIGLPATLQGVAWLASRRSARERRRVFDEHPVTPIARLEVGMVAKIRGVIEPFDRTLVAPLSGRPSVHHQTTIRTWSEHRGGVAHGLPEESVDFWVVGDTGRVLVRTGPMRFVLDVEQTELGRASTLTREELAAQLGHQVRVDHIDLAVVASLDVGERVAVFGRIGRDPDGRDPRASSDRRRAPGGFSVVVDESVPRTITDVPDIVGP